jgi:hypothetical protein
VLIEAIKEAAVAVNKEEDMLERPFAICPQIRSL